MFKRHVYTCPDVIHMRKVNRRLAAYSVVVQLATVGALAVYGHYQEKQMDKFLEELDDFDED